MSDHVDSASPLDITVMRHTPGPWRIVRQNPSPTTGEWMISGAMPGYLAEVRDCGSGDVRANAELIASAPDLLIENMNLKAAIERMRCAGGSVEFQIAFELAKDLLTPNAVVQASGAQTLNQGTAVFAASPATES